MSTIKAIGRYLDQPLLVGKFTKALPATLTTGAALFAANEVRKAPEGKKKKTALNTGIVLAATVASALAAPRIASAIVRKPLEKVNLNEIKQANKELVEGFLSENPVSKTVKNVLEKAKSKVLGIKDMKTLNKEIGNTENGKKFIDEFVPEPENITSKDILRDVGRLSILGLVPVVGGVTGGIVADAVTDKKHCKEKLPNKIKEGAYQYLANIMLCNVGAAGALGIMEAAKVKSKAARAASMVAGIFATGVIGGSAIANVISKKCIDPLLGCKKNTEARNEKLYSERTPEALDIGLHVDDIATVAVMSGLRWIEPALPILYSISGYRAGIGYRNGEEQKELKG